MTHSLTAVGDAGTFTCWSGIPYHFREAARRSGFITDPVRLDLSKLNRARIAWNGKQIPLGRGHGGFHYSDRFLNLIKAQVPPDLLQGEIIIFNQHFPRAAALKRCNYLSRAGT